VLELGSGRGDLWRANLERIPHGWNVTLSDLSPGMLEEARAHLGAYAARFHFMRADAQAIPFADGVFDAVIANHMLYHVPDIPRALVEIARVLKPGGALYAATNGGTHLCEIGELVGRVAPAAATLWGERAALPFRLENGGELLAQHFAVVSARRYENALRVTEIEPLVAYIRSTPLGTLPPEDAMARLRSHIAEEIATHGALTITAETGIFQAIRGEER
nr:class I SAM-dependent methyltransferase [Ktedonobacterales bacterium]